MDTRVRNTLLTLLSVALVSCETHRTAVSTAPDVPPEEAGVAVDVKELGATATTPTVGATTLGGPLPGLDAEQLARFNAGRDNFMEVNSAEDGLGPVFNEASCVACHDAPVGGTNGRAETRFGRWSAGGFDPLAEHGGSLMQDHAIGAVAGGAGTFTYVPEVVPSAANVRATRITTPLFGLGLVDAVPDLTFILLARLQAIYSPATRGRPNLVTEVRTGATRVGRFGWKAQVPTLHEFAGDAYLNEMGITSPEFPSENCPQGDCGSLAFNPFPTLNNDGKDVARFADFMTLLVPPPRSNRSFLTLSGEYWFAQVGCASCHTPALVTGFSPVPALSRKVFLPYSDFLLHEMGALGDGIAQGRAGPREMRTAPLWGLGARKTFLHDGRATSIEDAILAHSGQGAPSRARYSRLPSGPRTSLLAFLRSL